MPTRGEDQIKASRDDEDPDRDTRDGQGRVEPARANWARLLRAGGAYVCPRLIFRWLILVCHLESFWAGSVTTHTILLSSSVNKPAPCHTVHLVFKAMHQSGLARTTVRGHSKQIKAGWDDENSDRDARDGEDLVQSARPIRGG
jgi:hypothetical protein